MIETQNKHNNYEPTQAKKGTYGFSDLMRANEVDDIIYDVTVGNVKHASRHVSKILYHLFSKVLAKIQRKLL